MLSGLSNAGSYPNLMREGQKGENLATRLLFNQQSTVNQPSSWLTVETRLKQLPTYCFGGIPQGIPKKINVQKM